MTISKMKLLNERGLTPAAWDRLRRWERGNFLPFRYLYNHNQEPARRPMSFYVRHSLVQVNDIVI
jgi:hypothetical protein